MRLRSALPGFTGKEPGRSEGSVRVEIVFALPDRQELVSLRLDDRATVAEAIEKSLLAEMFPDCDLAACPVGIWGRIVDREHTLRDGDRVEIYRPLAIDPQTTRRALAAEGKAMGHSRDKSGRK